MTQNASLNDLMDFLDYLSNKGLMKEQTVASRKATANKVFATLDDEDRNNVLAGDMDELMNRFVNKKGTDYSPGSLQTYKSRLKGTLEDFAAYLQDPMGFKPSVQQRRSRQPNTEDKQTADRANKNPTRINPPQRIGGVTTPSADILPIPLRLDLVVKVQGLPYDLTESEANKISTVIRAFVAAE